MSASDPIPPVLTYADPSTNALPDWFDAVEAMLDAREPVWKLSAMFPNSTDAVSYVVRSLAVRFQPAKTPDCCEVCHQPCPTIAPIHWRVRIVVKAGEVVRSGNSMPSEAMAKTFHTLCADCHRAASVRKYTRPWQLWVGVVVAVVGIAAIGISGVFIKVSKGDGLQALGALAMGVGGLLAGLAMTSVRCQVPTSLRDRLPPDLIPAGIGQLFDWPRPAKGGTP